MKLDFLFNRKHYRYIIIGLILVILFFLLLGNYNLRFKEGLTDTADMRSKNMEEQISKFTSDMNIASGGLKQINKQKDVFANNHATRAHAEKEGFLENSENMCDSINNGNSSELIPEASIIQQGVCDQVNSIEKKNPIK